MGARLASAALTLGFIGDDGLGEGVDLPLLSDPPANNASWGGPAFTSITRDGPATFTVHLAKSSGIKMVGSRGCADVAIFDDGANRSVAERCCNAPDTFQLWPSIDATQQAAPWAPAPGSGPTLVKCTIVGTALRCVSPTPITGITYNQQSVWTFAWQNFPPCMLVNDAQLPASPMRAVVPQMQLASNVDHAL